jgi:hypothetical protein
MRILAGTFEFEAPGFGQEDVVGRVALLVLGVFEAAE